MRKDYKITMDKILCPKIYAIRYDSEVTDENLKQIILSHIRANIINVSRASETMSLADYQADIKENQQEIIESTNNLPKENWIDDFNVSFVVNMPEKIYNQTKIRTQFELTIEEYQQ
ncbi:hypothetical protein [Mangrovibacterium marinum]|uniref:hypothetical protein n=1 Tax=Mangrovibacterium marinum TaxID=1639118 RepID=UPI002A18753A|nr:hypothetical protein [Mangrovibacterium marinum]